MIFKKLVESDQSSNQHRNVNTANGSNSESRH